MTKKFYVYGLFRPWDGSPCYIGKGHGHRHLHHARRGENHPNKRLARIFSKAGGQLPAIIIHKNLDEQAALAYEIELIAAIGRGQNGPLVNMTNGGEGVSGLKHSEKTKLMMSEAHAGKVFTQEHRANLKKAWVGRVPHPNSLSAYPRKFMKGLTPWNKGRKQSEIQRIKIQELWTDERRAAASQYWSTRGHRPPRDACIKGGYGKRGIKTGPNKSRGVPKTAEHRLAISKSRFGNPHPHKGVRRSAECRAKISATKRLAAASAALAAAT